MPDVTNEVPPGWYARNGRMQWWNGTAFTAPPAGCDSPRPPARPRQPILAAGVAAALVLVLAGAAASIAFRDSGDTDAMCSGRAFEEFLSHTGMSEGEEACFEYQNVVEAGSVAGPGDLGSGIDRRTLRRDGGLTATGCTLADAVDVADRPRAGCSDSSAQPREFGPGTFQVQRGRVGNQRRTDGPGLVQVVAPAPRWHLTAGYQNEQPYSQHQGSVTEALAIEQAKAFDMLTVQSKSVSGGTGTEPPTTVLPIYTRTDIAAMRTANPRFRIAPYVNAGTTRNTDHPENWYAHDASGARVVNTDWGVRYVMQPDNPEWRDFLRGYAFTVFSSSDYDDLFLDVLGDYPLELGSVKPGTTTIYTSAEWYAMTMGLAGIVQEALPAGARAVPNGLKNGGRFPVSKALVTNTAAGMAEIFSRTATAPYTSSTTGQDVGVRTLASWQAELTMIEELGAAGKVGKFMIKDWTGDPQAEERVKYGFATAMLATNGTHYVEVSLGLETTMNTYSWLSGTDYGSPLGPYAVDAAGVYQRVFSKATIAVNPTAVAWSGSVRGQTVSIPARRAAFVVDPL